jgi:hypothetical protein
MAVALVISEFRGKPAMKTALLAMTIFCSAAAFGQAGSVSSQAAPLEMSDHPQHATYTSMAAAQSLSPSDTITYAKGERPLWEFGPFSVPVPLGDVARAYRKEKQTAKKAEVIFEKQGS